MIQPSWLTGRKKNKLLTYVTFLVREKFKRRRTILWPRDWERQQVGLWTCLRLLLVRSFIPWINGNWVIQHTRTHPPTHSLTEAFYFFSLNFQLTFNTNSSGEWKLQILLNQKHVSHNEFLVTSPVDNREGYKAQGSQSWADFIWLSRPLKINVNNK